MLPPYEYEWTCFGCGYNVIKRKHELFYIRRKEINFINRFKYAEHKMFCFYKEVYKIHEGNDFDKIFEDLSKLKNKKLKNIYYSKK